MSIDTVAALASTTFAPVDRTAAVTQTPKDKQASLPPNDITMKEPPTGSVTAALTPRSTIPLLLVPTDPPLTTEVLAEITARLQPGKF